MIIYNNIGLVSIFRTTCWGAILSLGLLRIPLDPL